MWRRFLRPRSQKSRSSFLLYGFLIGDDLLYCVARAHLVHSFDLWPVCLCFYLLSLRLEFIAGLFKLTQVEFVTVSFIVYRHRYAIEHLV
jgi:hypothetical protein